MDFVAPYSIVVFLHVLLSSQVTCASLHRSQSFYLLVIGFASGLFGLYELPDANALHTLSISQHKIHTVAINPTGEWLAFGAGKLGMEIKMRRLRRQLELMYM